MRDSSAILSLPRGEQKRNKCITVKYWEIIADNLSKAGWSWGCVSALDCNGRTIWIVDAHRDDGKRLVVFVKAFGTLSAQSLRTADFLDSLAAKAS